MGIKEQYNQLRNSRRKHNQDMQEMERKESNRREETPFDDIEEEIFESVEPKHIVTPLVSVQEEEQPVKSTIIPNVGDIRQSEMISRDRQILEKIKRREEKSNLEEEKQVQEEVISQQLNKQSQEQKPAPTRNMSANKEPKKPEKKKEVLFEIVIDATLSFTTVYQKAFYILKQFLNMMKQVKKEYRGVVFQYGLTVFHESDDVFSIEFGTETYFTESETDFIEALSNIVFYGGSETGREDFTSALDHALYMLNSHGEENASRGILFFSDSIPDEEQLEPDFTEMVQDGYLNKGLRFAQFYTGTDDFCPKMLMVNGDGNFSGNAKNEASYECLEYILKADPNKVSQELKEMVNNILNQTSVLM